MAHTEGCVHRVGSDHPGMPCNVCERGDCDAREDGAVDLPTPCFCEGPWIGDDMDLADIPESVLQREHATGAPGCWYAS